ncbi:beta strand repeat-containing protein [Verrucomicrobiota bacterium sgz303538]
MSLAVGTPQVQAADGTWTQAGTNNQAWSTATNWNASNVADGVDSSAIFNVNLTNDQTITLGATGRTIGHLFFRDSDTATTGGFGIGTSGDGALTLDVTSGPSVVNVATLGSSKKLAVTVPIINNDGILKINSGELSIRADSPGMTGSLIAAGGLTNTRSFLSNLPSIQVTAGGTFQVDFANSGANITNLVNGTAPVTLGGTVAAPSTAIPPSLPLNFNTPVAGNGTLTITGKASTANVQSFGGLTLNPGTHTVNVVNGGDAGASATLYLGAITRNPGSSVNFTASGGGISSIRTTTANGSGSILGGWAIVGGNTWVFSAGDGTLAGAITGLDSTSYTSDSWGAGKQTDVVAGIASAIGVTNSVRFNTAAATAVTLTGASSVTSGGILVTSTVGTNASQITGGSLTSGTNELIVIQNNTNTGGTLTIASKIEDNGAPVAFTKAGSGTVILTGNNTYTGTTYVSSGTLQIAAGGSLASGTIVNNATLNVDTTTITGNISGTGVLNKNGTGVLTLSGNNTFTGQFNHSAGTVAVTSDTALGAGTFRFNVAGVTLQSGNTSARTIGNFLDIANNAVFGAPNTGDLTFTGTLAMGNGAKDMTINNGVTTFTGVMTGGPSENYITKKGSGTMVLANAASTAVRPISIEAGVLQISGEGNLGANPSASNPTTPRQLKFNGGTLQATASFTIDDSNRGVYIDTNGGSISVDSGATLTVANGIAGTGALTKIGAGTLNLSAANTYIGETTVNAGTLVVSGSLGGTTAVRVNSGALQLGANNVLNDAATVTLGGGTLSTVGFDDNVGALTLSVSSTINLGAGDSVVHFADSSAAAWNGTLSISNWSGSLSGGGTDQVFFGSSAAGLTVAQIAAIQFVNPEGLAPGNYGAQLLPSGEIVAVPEPATIASLIGGVGVLLGFGRASRRRQRA